MVNKKDLRGGAEKMREVAQLLSAWADDLEASGEKKSRKKAAEPDEAVASADVAVPEVEPAEEAAPAAAAMPVEEAAVPVAAARAEIGYEDLRNGGTVLAFRLRPGCFWGWRMNEKKV